MRRAHWTVAAIAAITMLAACGGGPGGGSSSGETLTVGLLAPLTGTVAQTAEQQRDVVQLKVDQINAAGGVAGRQLTLKVYDTKTDPATATQQAQRAISQDRVGALIGPWTSTEGLAVAEMVERAKVVDINSSAAAAAITQGRKYVFRTGPLTNDLATGMMRLAKAAGRANGALLYDSSSFGKGAKGPLEDAAKAAGIGLTAGIEYPIGASDVSAQVAAAAKSTPQAVFVAGAGGADYGLIGKTMVEQGLNVPLIGFGPVITPDAIKIAGSAYDALPGVYTLGCVDGSKPQVKELLDAYNAKHPPVSVLPEQVLQAVDALNWLVAGFGKTAGKGGEDLASALENLPATPSIGGRTGAVQQFTATDHDGYGSDYLVPYKVEGGKTVQASLDIDS